jgi:hypothetical protein
VETVCVQSLVWLSVCESFSDHTPDILIQKICTRLICEFQVYSATEWSGGLARLGAHGLRSDGIPPAFSPECLVEARLLFETRCLIIPKHLINLFFAMVRT